MPRLSDVEIMAACDELDAMYGAAAEMDRQIALGLDPEALEGEYYDPVGEERAAALDYRGRP